MTIIEKTAKELNMKPKNLLEISLKTYLQQKLIKLDAEYFLIAKKYGVKDIFDLDKKIREGFFSEEYTYEDFFTFDNLQAERGKIEKILEKL